MNKYKIEVMSDNVVIDVFYEECKTEKGVEKKNKQRFKEYRALNYTWNIEEMI